MSQYPPQFNQQIYDANTRTSTQSRVSLVMKRVYAGMTLALLVTAAIAYFCCASNDYMTFFVTNRWFMWVLIAAEFGIVIGVSAGIRKLSTATAFLLFIAFAVVNGLFLGPVLYGFSPTVIAKTFLITAGMFAGMSIYGFTTSRDLTKWGNILFMGLIGLIICSVVNIFVGSDGFGWLISIFGVLIFTGLTAWDTWQIKKMAEFAPNDSIGRLAVLGSLSLYLDFINLFLYLLRFFGGRD